MSNSGENNQQPKLWTPVFVVIIVIALCAFTVGQGLNAGSTVYINRLGGGATLAGVGAGMFSAAAGIARVICGPLADLRGRLIAMAVGAVVLVVGVLGSALAASPDTFLLWRFLQGVGFAFVTTTAATAAADVLPVERLGEGIGYYGLGQALAMSFGPALAISLVAADPPETLYWGLAIPATLALVACAFCRYEKHPDTLPETATYRTIAKQRESNPSKEKPRLIDSILEPGALAGAIPIMVISPAMGFGIFFSGLLGTSLGVGNAGVFYTLSAVTMIAVRLASKSFMDRTPAIKIHAVAVLGGVVGFSLLIAAATADLDPGMRTVLFYAAGLPYGLCPGLAIPVNQTVAVKNSSAERWGAANGLFLLLVDVGIGIAATVWGITNDLYGFTFTLGCVIVLIIASLGVAMLCYPPEDKRWRR